MDYETVGRANLYKQLPKELINEDEGVYTVGEMISHDFYYGNYGQAVRCLREACVTAIEYLQYLEEYAEDLGSTIDDIYSGHFSRDFFICLGRDIL